MEKSRAVAMEFALTLTLEPPHYTKPVFLPDDAIDLSNIYNKWGKRFVTKIVSNPPHGWGFSEISGMNEEACYQLFIKHVRKIYELELLTIDGEAYYAIPYVWVDRLFKENLPCEILVLENQVEGKRLSIVCLKQKSSSLFSTVKSPKRIAPLSYHLKRLLGFLSISRSL